MKLSKRVEPFRRSSKGDLAEQELQELVWMAIDGDASEADIARLEDLVKTQQSARRAYREAMEMDGILGARYASSSRAPQAT